MKRINQFTLGDGVIDSVHVEVWEHEGRTVKWSYSPIQGYYAMTDEDTKNIGHSGPDNPSGIIMWVLHRLGLL